MLDTDLVAMLRAEGLTLRDIAARLSTSVGAVQRALARRPPPPADDDNDGLTDHERAVLDAVDIDFEPILPFTFVGLDSSTPCIGGETYTDRLGRPFDQMALYRWGLRHTDPATGKSPDIDVVVVSQTPGHARHGALRGRPSRAGRL